CEIARFSPDKRLRYEKEMITERDYRNILETAREDGFAEGEAKGLAEGEAKGLADGEAKGRAAMAAEIARAMLASGMEHSLISSLTGLSQEEIKGL
ncbi:MAG: transposase, partial [Bacteroidetes bacterium]|nr:transposase [Candidatus Cryptobacteroides excrementipullorum]